MPIQKQKYITLFKWKELESLNTHQANTVGKHSFLSSFREALSTNRYKNLSWTRQSQQQWAELFSIKEA